ncbi:MAG TPA: ATP-binding protein [Acidobacteriota bacterium]
MMNAELSLLTVDLDLPSSTQVINYPFGGDACRDELADRYQAALQEHLATEGERSLQRACQLGRSAFANGWGVLEMAALHHKALASVLPSELTPVKKARILKAAADFFLESLVSFEMSHRGFCEANTALRRMNERLEEEAKRIAHALHDDVGQLVALVHIALQGVISELPPSAQPPVKEVVGMLDQIEERVRCLSHELRPTILDHLGLLPALQFLADGVSKRAELSIRVEGFTDGRLAPSVETALYRIVQEALNNVRRHARATRVRIKVRREEKAVHCCIQDDGVGFEAGAVLDGKGEGGLGLTGIRERLDALGGMLQILSASGKGTKLLITVPLSN